MKNEGTIAFWVTSENPRWLSDDSTVDCEPIQMEGVRCKVNKDVDRLLTIEIDGPLGRQWAVVASVPPTSEQKLFVALTWTDGTLQLYLQGQPVAAVITDAGPAKGMVQARRENEFLFGVYLQSVAEVRRASGCESFGLLSGSAAARRLLMDQSSLVDQVNRIFRLKLRFPAYDGSDGPLGRDEFLSEVVCVVAATQVSTADIIRFCANVMGGVHRSSSGTPVEDALLAQEIYPVRGSTPEVLLVLRNILSRLVAGLEPLTSAVIDRMNTEDLQSRHL